MKKDEVFEKKEDTTTTAQTGAAEGNDLLDDFGIETPGVEPTQPTSN